MRGLREMLALLLVVSMFTAVFPASAGTAPLFVPPPTDGLEVTFFDGFENQTVRFEPGTQALTGYLEERDVHVARLIDGGGDRPYDRLVFDEETGVFLGAVFSEEWDFPLFGALDSVQRQVTSDHSATYMIGAWRSLPESVLWNRYLLDGAAWDVPGWAQYCDHSSSVSVGLDGIVTVEIRCDLGDRVQVDSWRLDFGDDPGPFAEERILTRSLIMDGTISTDPPVSYPVVVSNATGSPLRFEGYSQVPIVDGRDRTLRYGPTELTPYDPEPDEDFDLDTMAKFVLSRPLDDVRTFRAGADDMWLFYAYSEPATPTRYILDYWALGFLDDKGRALFVHLEGTRLPTGEFVPVREDASLQTLAGVGRPIGDLAAPGDLVRATERFAEDRPERPTAWLWLTMQQTTIFGTDFGSPLCSIDELRSVYLDLASGVVTGSSIQEESQSVVGVSVPTERDCGSL